MHAILFNVFSSLVHFLKNYMNWYFVIFICLLIYEGFHFIIKKQLDKQMIRRKKVLDEIHSLKEPYRKTEESQELGYIEKKIESILNKIINVIQVADEKNEKAKKLEIVKTSLIEVVQKNSFLEVFRFQSSLKNEEIEKIQEESKKIIKKHKVKPYYIIFLFIIQIIVFIGMALTFKGIHEVHYSIIYPILTLIFTFLIAGNRYAMILLTPIFLLCFAYYRTISGAANIFLMTYIIYSYLKKWIKDKKNSKEKKEII